MQTQIISPTPHYRFNISHNGNHVFNTGDTCISRDHANSLFEVFQTKFPESEGYKIECVHWSTTGEVEQGLSSPE